MDHYDLVVVGAGIAGMRVAQRLKAHFPAWSVAVVERAPRCGGRIHTTLDAEGRVEYEDGPWRVHVSHTLARASIEEMGLSFVRYGASKRRLSPRRGAVRPEARGGKSCGDDEASLSDWDAVATREGPTAADERGYATGYGPAFQRGACGTSVYRAPRRRPGGGEEGGDFDAVAEGLSEWVSRLSRDLQKAGVKILLSHKVVDIRPTTCGRRCNHKRYCIHLQHRQKESLDKAGRAARGNLTERRIRARLVCLALPPRFTNEWPSIAAPLAPLRSQVGSLPLMHVYARFSDAQEARRLCLSGSGCSEGGGFHLVHSGISCQLISPPGGAGSAAAAAASGSAAESCWVQVAYTGGEAAEALQRTRLRGLTQLRDCILEDLVRAGVERSFLERQPWAKAEGEELTATLRPCHYAHAVHLWHPARGLDAESASRIAATGPHPRLLSGLVFAGEAISLKQGWIEGALETADVAVEALKQCHEGSSAMRDKYPDSIDEEVAARRCVEYDGWLVDVEAWSDVHPGSKGAIAKFLGGKKVVDVTDVFRHVSHSAQALRIMAALRVGFRDRSGAWRVRDSAALANQRPCCE